MGKWKITWDVGYGPNYEVIEASDRIEAEAEAYESWREEAETNAYYVAEPCESEECCDD